MTTPHPPTTSEASSVSDAFIPGQSFAQVYGEELHRWVEPASQLRDRRQLKDLSPIPDVSNGLVGLALSGGGIRSATFALGACQAMARSDVLEQVDYLSTVSGGGFLGAAFSSLLHGQAASTSAARTSGESASPADDVKGSRHPLARNRFPFRFGTQETATRQFKAERATVRRLREMSNYLAPRLGLLDTQTWYAFFRTLTMSIIAILVFALPPIVLLVLGLTAIPGAWWERANPAATGGILWWPMAVGGFACASFALSLIPGLEHWPRIGFLRRFLLFPPLIVVLWVVFCLLVQVAWSFEWLWRNDWTIPARAGGAGALALIPAVRWAFTKLGDIDNVLSAAKQATIQGWLRTSLPQLAIGLLGYAVLALIAVVLYLLLDRFVTKEARWGLAAVFAVPLVLTLIPGLLIGLLNSTSLHSFYRDRLRTCYIQQEQGDRVTTGNEADVPLHLLQAERGSKPPLGPYHLVNTALNISGSSDVEELGRKSDSFTLATLYSGSPRTGYAATNTGGLDRLTLGAAMAISGAAVSPNQGTANNTSLSILLTLLNARLGYWLQNPLTATKDSAIRVVNSSPLLLYWKEMFGKASSRDRDIYLSDGGHFDNSGIYELVRRRCKYIIAIDGSGEPSPMDVRFPTIGIVSRLVRIDFGVDIKAGLERVTPDTAGITPSTYALGRVLYPPAFDGEPEDKRTGLLLYVRATLTKEVDAPDLNYYKRMNPIYPNHSTADQFFDEAQFEAYRALGYNTVRSIFRQPLAYIAEPEVQALCDAWNAIVAPPAPATDSAGPAGPVVPAAPTAAS